MLLDTSGLFCFVHAGDPHHERAARLWNEAGVLITHNYVLAEFVALCIARGLPTTTALPFVSQLDARRLVDLVFVDQALHRDAMRLLIHRADKRWSLCDAVSFVLMQQRDLTDALTTDHDFEQAGFVRLLK
jgi:predicted nucleic acid-binding protein